MHAIHNMLVAAAIALAASANAQDCSGGGDGGMDATGNQCSRSNAGENAAATKINSQSISVTSARSDTAARQVPRPEGTAIRERAVVAANPATQRPKRPEPVSVAPRAVKITATTGAN